MMFQFVIQHLWDSAKFCHTYTISNSIVIRKRATLESVKNQYRKKIQTNIIVTEFKVPFFSLRFPVFDNWGGLGSY